MKNRETDEWLKQNERSTRNFLRKWGHYCKHDALMKPIIPPKYDIGFIVKNCEYQLLEFLEPWCSTIYVDCDYKSYVEREQINTHYDLLERIKPFDNEKNNEILVTINGKQFSNEDYRYIQSFAEILANDKDLELGSFQLGNLQITINSLKTYETELIICKEK